MNTYVIVGTILVALGTLVTIVGTQRATRTESERTAAEVREEVGRTLEAIESVRASVSDPEAQKVLAEAEGEFKDWAERFLANRERRFHELSQSEGMESQREVDLSDERRPLWEATVSNLDGLARALQAREEDILGVELPPVPLNLFDGYEGWVTFKGGGRLTLWGGGRGGIKSDLLPVLTLSASDSDDRVMVALAEGGDSFQVVVIGGSGPFRALPESLPKATASAEFRAFFEKLLELQIYLVTTRG